MADFSGTKAKVTAVNEAASLQEAIRSMYEAGKRYQALVARYQAGTDTTFVAAVNAVYTAAQRTELGVIKSGVDTFITDMETNHSSAINS